LEKEKENLSLDVTKYEKQIEDDLDTKTQEIKSITDQFKKQISGLETEKNNYYEELQDNQKFK
jgi:cell shape-determining protein MreC